MNKIGAQLQNLSAYLEYLQSRGRLTFTSKEAISKLKVSKIAFNRQAQRLMKKKRLIHPVRGFYVIVPVEKKLSGSPDPSWFIDDLMKFQGQPYYIGVLSAAQIHGAAHQSPQEFQVVTNSRLKPIQAGSFRIRFLTKKWMERTPTQLVKTPSGYIPVSTPEATVFDLIQYIRWAGYLNNVSTILTEISEKLDVEKLVASAKICNELALVQRLGYLLDQFANSKLTSKLYAYIIQKKPAFTMLQPNWESSYKRRNKKWCLIVNKKVEPDV